MAKRKRRSFSIEQKAAILRRHLVDRVPVSDLCDEYKLQPSLFYSWRNTLFDNLEVALDNKADARVNKREKALNQQIESLESKLVRKNDVIAEISEEYVKLKKELGET